MISLKNLLSVSLKIIVPIVIGFGVIYILFGQEIVNLDIHDIPLGETTIVGILAALMLLILREAGLAWRFRSLTDNELSIRKSLKITLICDFTSTVTPTSAGGSILSMIFLHKEGLSIGRSTAITIVTLVLDGIYFLVVAPLVLLIVSGDGVFAFAEDAAATDLRTLFWIVYGIMATFTILLYIGIFHSPKSISRILVKLFSLPLLRRWKNQVEELGSNLITTSTLLRNNTLKWWMQPILATILTWTSRFLIINALFYAFFPEANQGVVFARQLVVWGILIFTPTPGGSGVSEFLFKTYYSDMVFGPLLAVLAISWRILTYYVFLMAGTLIIPSYLRLKKQAESINS